MSLFVAGCWTNSVKFPTLSSLLCSLWLTRQSTTRTVQPLIAGAQCAANREGDCSWSNLELLVYVRLSRCSLTTVPLQHLFFINFKIDSFSLICIVTSCYFKYFKGTCPPLTWLNRVRFFTATPLVAKVSHFIELPLHVLHFLIWIYGERILALFSLANSKR